MLSNIDHFAPRARRSKVLHPLVKLLATLFFSALFLAAIVLTGGHAKNEAPPAANVIDANAEDSSPTNPGTR